MKAAARTRIPRDGAPSPRDSERPGPRRPAPTLDGLGAPQRTWLVVTPNADLTLRGVNVHHLFTGVVVTTVAAIPLALASSRGTMRRVQVAALGTGLGLMLDEWVYLLVTDGSNAAYLLPVSAWGAVFAVSAASAYAVGCHLRARRGSGEPRLPTGDGRGE